MLIQYATEAPARRVIVRASYARTKQDLRVGNITYRQVLFHLPDQAWMSTQPTSPLVKKVRSMPCVQGFRTHFMSSSVLVPSNCVDVFKHTPTMLSESFPVPFAHSRHVARAYTRRVSCRERNHPWDVNKVYFGIQWNKGTMSIMSFLGHVPSGVHEVTRGWASLELLYTYTPIPPHFLSRSIY
jgi:hypothetical protein